MPSEREENLSNSTSSCERVFATILCCRCQTDEDVSVHKHKRMPGETSSPKVPTKSQKAKAAEEKQLELPKKAVAEKAQASPVEGKGSALTKSDTFTDYIHRAKMKIRTMSNTGYGNNASETDVVHDRYTRQESNSKDGFSDYIHRAKMKIRKTSSVGSRKSYSLRRE